MNTVTKYGCMLMSTLIFCSGSVCGDQKSEAAFEKVMQSESLSAEQKASIAALREKFEQRRIDAGKRPFVVVPSELSASMDYGGRFEFDKKSMREVAVLLANLSQKEVFVCSESNTAVFSGAFTVDSRAEAVEALLAFIKDEGAEVIEVFERAYVLGGSS